MDMEERARLLLNPKHYENAYRIPQIAGTYKMWTPDYNQYILRMLVKSPYTMLSIPYELKWVENLILRCQSYQRVHFIEHPFIYLTVRHGPNVAEDDDVWHVDGFSMRIPHLPEQNYIWSNHTPTEFYAGKISIPRDFNPAYHNISSIFQQQATSNVIMRPDNNAISVLDPYIVHRRPKVVGNRTMIRISFVPILIEDDDNTPNPLLPTIGFGKVGKHTRRNLHAYVY